jgi:exonuclease SbcC
MCSALFGDTSGAEREGKQMRCDASPPDLATLVRYEFALGPKRYCIERRPEQERPSKRGGGTTTDGHTATLWDRSQTTGADEEGKVLASGAAKVKAAVIDLFGFDSDQFRQVVMLPQGQFRKLLSAESKEKEKILQRLFQTSHYAKLERALADRANRLRRTFENDQVAMATLLAHEDVESVEALAERIVAAESQHKVLKEALPSFKKKSEMAAAALSKAKNDNLTLDEVQAASLASAALQAKEPEITEVRARCQRVKSAQPLIPRADSAAARAREASVADAELAAAESEQRVSAEARRLAAAALTAQEERGPEREDLSKAFAALEGMQGSVQRLEEVRASAAAIQTKMTDRLREHEEGAAALASAKASLESLRKGAASDDKQAAQLEALELGLKQQRAEFAKGVALGKLRSDAKIAIAAHDAALQALRDVETRLAGKESALAELEARWQSGQAAALARELRAGEACPVCGSAEHPNLAAASESLPSDDERARAGEAVRDARSEAAKAQEAEASSRAARSSVEARQESLGAELGAAAERLLSEWELALAEREAEVGAAKQASARQQESGPAIAAAELAVVRSEELLAGLAAAREEGRIEAAALSGSLQELESKVPVELRPAGSLHTAMAAAETKLLDARKAYEGAQQAAALASERYAASEATCGSAKEAAKLSRDKAIAAATEFASHLEAAGFADPESFARAKAALPNLDEWEEQIRRHEGEVQAAADRLARAQLAADGKTRADLSVLSAMAEECSAALELEIGREADARNQCERLNKVQSEHESIRKRVAEAEAQWRVVASVSDLANGKVPPKVSFQRFVLGALLDEVLLAASERLLRMSQGRYTLQRQALSRHKAKASGLEMEVLDSYSGTPRSVATLSGGESFLAALALSLGLADVVQGFSGGIRLDTLLIDEGFGTLDSDALDLALDTLTNLNAAGRLVGIISHVDELKSRIPTRLEVLKGDSGSSTRFVGG